MLHVKHNIYTHSENDNERASERQRDRAIKNGKQKWYIYDINSVIGLAHKLVIEHH